MIDSIRMLLILFTIIMEIVIVVNRNKQPGDLLVFILFLLYLFFLLNS